ncbi:MAG: type II toxin-antitoxin system VapC family toxin [Leptospiraceae bacterium]|nr:type II toxin-antitoxin system VapC family toxin [Leptospiraceae bacterium]
MIVIDTHIWIWLVTEQFHLFTEKQNKSLNDNKENLLLSSISQWEIAKKVEMGKLKLSMDVLDWIQLAIRISKIKVIDLTPEIVVQSTKLTDFHKDPADQLIAATSLIMSCPLVTSDSKIISHNYINTVY